MEPAVTRTAVKGMGSLLEMLQCGFCWTFEWDQSTIDVVHAPARTSGLTCVFQEAAKRRLGEMVRAGDGPAARSAYQECRRLYVPHIDAYAFAVLQRTTMPLMSVFGEVHKYVGSLRPDGTYGVLPDGVRPLEVCACGERFPGVSPRRGIYDQRPYIRDHIRATGLMR